MEEKKKQRLEETFNSDTVEKSLDGKGSVKIDPTKVGISNGQIVKPQNATTEEQAKR